MTDNPIPNLRHLRAFREVARSKSINQASRQVHLSQPAITQAIAKLEQTLGTQVFERRPDGMDLTETGSLFLRRVDSALDHIQEGAREAIRVGSKKGGRGFSNFDQLMTAVQMRALIAVADAGNFSLAARMVGTSQPSLYRAARDLERLSGITLFEKSGQDIVLTRGALALVKHAKVATAELRQGFMEVAEWLGLDSGRIVVGTLPLARSYVLPHAINHLTRDRPDVLVSVIDGPYEDLLNGLRHGEIDVLIGALRDPLPIDDVCQERLFDDELAVVARAGHPLFDQDVIRIEDLVGYPWVTPRKGTPTRRHFEALFSFWNSTPPTALIESSSLVLIRSLLAESDRLTIISPHQIRHELELGILRVLPVRMDRTERPIGITTRRRWRPTATQAVFLKLLKQAGEQVHSAENYV